MNCPNCGTNINQGENFCRMCGTQVVFPSETNTIPTPNAFEQKPINEEIIVQENNITAPSDITNSSNPKIEETISVVTQVSAQTEISNNTQVVPNAFNQQPMSAETIIEQNQMVGTNTIIENQTNIEPRVVENNVNTPTETPSSVNQATMTTVGTITQNQMVDTNTIIENQTNIEPSVVENNVNTPTETLSSTNQATMTTVGTIQQNQINSENNISTNPIEITPTIVPVESQNVINTQNSIQQESNFEKPIMSSDENGMKEEKPKYQIDETLLNAYIGVNVEKLKDGSFSWSALFLATYYTLYRKMWLLSIVWFVGVIIISMFLPSFSNIISFIINFVVALQFKDWYINHAVEKIKKIKLDNPNASEEELIKICRKKGGTSITAALSPFIILIILYFAATMLSGKLENSKVNTSEYLRTNIIREKI